MSYVGSCMLQAVQCDYASAPDAYDPRSQPTTLASHLDGSWAIVDCRYDLQGRALGTRAVPRRHIPGAVYASLSHDLAAPPTGTNGRHPLPVRRGRWRRRSAGSGICTGDAGRDLRPGHRDVREPHVVDAALHGARRGRGARRRLGEVGCAKDGRVRAGEETARRRPCSPAAGARSCALTARRRCKRRSATRRCCWSTRARPSGSRARASRSTALPGHIPGAVNHFYKRNVTDDGVMLPRRDAAASSSTSCSAAGRRIRW